MPNKHEPTSAELAQEEQDAVAAALGEPDPPPPAKSAPRPDKRDAIQIERDEQARVEKAVHGITTVEGKP